MMHRTLGTAMTAAGALLVGGLVAFPRPSPAAESLFRGEQLAIWLERLADLDPDVQNVAAFAAGRFGPRASLAVTELLRMMRERETTRSVVPLQSNAAAAAEALGHIKITTPDVLAALCQQAKQPALVSRIQRDEARAAIEALGRFGERAKVAVPDLVTVLERPVREGIAPLDGIAPLQHDAAKALGEIGPDAAAAIPALEAVIKESEDLLLTMMAREALKKIRGEVK